VKNLNTISAQTLKIRKLNSCSFWLSTHHFPDSSVNCREVRHANCLRVKVGERNCSSGKFYWQTS